MTLVNTIALILTLVLQSISPEFTPEGLWQSWPETRFIQTPAPCLQPAELAAELERLGERYPGELQIEEAGRSVQGRSIYLVTLGHGERTVLLWSRMHGDEPSATPALLDIANFLLSRADQPEAAAILDNLTLLMIPMLNPDGAEVYQRRNFQGIDINRDALHLATPEGRILRRIRDEYEPELGFNLHDQGRRTVVADTGVLATISVLAVAGDKEGTVTPGRLRAERACAAIVEALAPFIPGGISRFNEDWNPRAFGDNLTAWGTPVVLVESGGLPPGRDMETLTRLNFVAILRVLQGLADNDLDDYDPEVYSSLPRTRRNGWADVIVRGGFLLQPASGPSYRADVAFNLGAGDRDAAGCGGDGIRSSRIVEVGDTRLLGAGRVVDAGESLLTPPFAAGVEGWSARRWMSSQVLRELARLGVGTVLWEVPMRKVEAAQTLAGELTGQGRASLEVVAAPAQMPWLRLSGPPRIPDSDSLSDVVNALVGGREGMTPLSSVILERLSAIPGSKLRPPSLRPGRAASFLLLSPVTEGRIDPETARLSSVFINGSEVLGESDARD